MFPSCNHGNDPISYSSQQVYNGHFFNDSISTSKQDELPFSFLHLPSPFQDELEIANYDVFIQHNHDLLPPQQPLQFNDPTISETMDSMVDSNKNDVDRCLTKICTKKSHHSAEQITIRKRSSKRDRHSKINTRQGPRDRRMRLSLKVAREFFDLQDMLGFDKPSKTVEWLLVRARDDIKKLSSSGLPQMNYSCSVGTKSASSTSECEVVSGIDEAAVKGSISISKGKTSSCVTKQKKTKLSRKTGIHVLIPRESRKEARERAKKRTKEKNLSQRTNESKLCEEASNHELSQLGCYCLSPFETGEESGIQSLTMNPSMDMLVEIEAPTGSHGQVPFGTAEAMIDDSSVMTTKWSPSFILNYLYNNGMPQDNHFTELDPLNKPWEP